MDLSPCRARAFVHSTGRRSRAGRLRRSGEKGERALVMRWNAKTARVLGSLGGGPDHLRAHFRILAPLSSVPDSRAPQPRGRSLPARAAAAGVALTPWWGTRRPANKAGVVVGEGRGGSVGARAKLEQAQAGAARRSSPTHHLDAALARRVELGAAREQDVALGAPVRAPPAQRTSA